MAAPTAPIDIVVTLDQAQVDAVWEVKEADFPQATNAAMQDKLVEFAKAGISAGIAESIRRRGRVVADQAAAAFESQWNS